MRFAAYLLRGRNILGVLGKSFTTDFLKVTLYFAMFFQVIKQRFLDAALSLSAWWSDGSK